MDISTAPSHSPAPRYSDLLDASFDKSDFPESAAVSATVQWLDALQEAIALVDFDGRVRGWNKAMAYLSGIKRNEAMGQKLFELLPAGFEKNLRLPIHQAFAHQLPSDGVFSLSFAADELFSFQYRVAMLEIDGLADAAMVSLVDKSDRERLLSKVRKLEQLSMFGAVSSGIAYELAGPLDAICASIDKMLNENEHSAEGGIEHGLHQILDEVYRISHLSNNIIALAHNQAPALMCIDVHDVIWEAVTVLEQNLNRSPICSMRLANSPALIAGDPLLLRSMISNILKNAIDAAGDDAVPLLETTFDGTQSVVVHIEDRGPASGAFRVQRIFDLPPHAHKLELGSELGMYLSKKIIDAHKGTIHVQGQDGRGTVYTVALPLQYDLFSDKEIA